MNIFLDTEFNGFGGDLISIGLVADDDQVFYGVLPCPAPISYVVANVMPVLGAVPLATETSFARGRLTNKLETFLRRYKSGFNIVADWPEDLAHFLGALHRRPGYMIEVPDFTMQLVRSLPPTACVSMVPHNALQDALALRACYYEANPERKP